MSISQIRLSKFLSLVLRHKPDEIGLALSADGWANIDELIEKADASGYHKRHRNDAAGSTPCVLAAVDVYVGMTTERADRPAAAGESAAAELRRLASSGVLDHRAVQAVLAAAGHDEPRRGKLARATNAGGLSAREV